MDQEQIEEEQRTNNSKSNYHQCQDLEVKSSLKTESKSDGEKDITSQDELVKYFEKLGLGFGKSENGESGNNCRLKSVTRLNFIFSRVTNSYCLEVELNELHRIPPGQKNLTCQSASLDLKMLTKFMEENSSSSFPCGKFGFFGGSLSEKDLQSFFNLHGFRIKELELDLDFSENILAFKNLLLVQVKNLELLHIKNDSICPSHWDFDFALEEDKDENKGQDPGQIQGQGQGQGQSQSRKLSGSTFQLKSFPSPLFENNLLLPNLKHLLLAEDYYLDSPFVQEMAKISPNLEYCDVFPYFCQAEDLELYARFDKLDSTTYHHFEIDSENLVLYEKFASIKPKLQVVGMSFTPSEFFSMDSQVQSRISHVVYTILKSSQNTLEFFGGVEFLSLLQYSISAPESECPFSELSFTKIGKMSLRPFYIMKYFQDASIPYKMIPGEISSLLKMFPVLNTLKIDCECVEPENEKYWINHFPLDFELELQPELNLDLDDACKIGAGKPLSISSVTELKVKNVGGSSFILEKLSSLFPYTRSLTVGSITDFPRVAPILWTKFPKLENLVLKLIVWSDSDKNQSYALDAAFTGLDLNKEICKKYQFTACGQEMNKIGPSIANLQGLQNLTVKFTNDGENIEWKLLTKLSATHGFDQIPGLQKPTIYIDIQPGEYGNKVEEELQSELGCFVRLFREDSEDFLTLDLDLDNSNNEK